MHVRKFLLTLRTSAMSDKGAKDGADYQSDAGNPEYASEAKDEADKVKTVGQLVVEVTVEETNPYGTILLRQGKALFSVGAYNEALGVFQKAADLGSYHARLLLGLTMIEISPEYYFEGLGHMIEAACSMLVRPYLDLLRTVLEKGHSRKLFPTYHGQVSPDFGEIAEMMHSLRTLDMGEQKKAAFGKLLRMLQASEAN